MATELANILQAEDEFDVSVSSFAKEVLVVEDAFKLLAEGACPENFTQCKQLVKVRSLLFGEASESWEPLQIALDDPNNGFFHRLKCEFDTARVFYMSMAPAYVKALAGLRSSDPAPHVDAALTNIPSWVKGMRPTTFSDDVHPMSSLFTAVQTALTDLVNGAEKATDLAQFQILDVKLVKVLQWKFLPKDVKDSFIALRGKITTQACSIQSGLSQGKVLKSLRDYIANPTEEMFG
jgi:hypothetical protein